MSASSTEEKASWTEELKGMLIQVLLTIAKDGSFTDNGYTKQEWTKILTLFKEMSNKAFFRQQISSKISEMKKDYTAYKSLQDLSGFGWNEAEHTVIAEPQVWDAYIASHPTARKLRQGLAYYAEMDEIFTGKVATGKYALSASSLAKRDRRDDTSVSDDGNNSEYFSDDLKTEGNNIKKVARRKEKEDPYERILFMSV